jgi:hypothetical protein
MRKTLKHKSQRQAKGRECTLSMPTREGRSYALQDLSDLTIQKILRSVAAARRVLRDEPFALGLFETIAAVYEQSFFAQREEAHEFDKKLRDFGGASGFPEPAWVN